MDISSGLNIQAGLNTIASQGISIASGARVWKVSAFAYFDPTFHAYMGVEGPLGRFAYDVALTRRNAARALQNKFSTVPAQVGMSRVDRFRGKGIEITKFNAKQWLVWSFWVLGTQEVEDVLAGTASCPIEYSYFLGPNCAFWTVKAIGKALLVRTFIK